jgi:hypothetical protein
MILAGVGALVVVTALGAAYGLSAAVAPGDSPAAASAQECSGQDGCVNRYNVALACGGESRTVTVEARDGEAAERKAERYNRDCRSRGSVFIGALVRSAAISAIQQRRAVEPDRRATRSTTTATRRWRFRRR